MITKKIHWVWLSGEEIPPFLKKCMETWQEILPDYEVKCWTKDNFDVDSVEFVKEACSLKKWAFACDYIRAYALYHEGGIYLDSDVRVIRPFTQELLNSNFFIGTEIHKNYWNNVDFNKLLDETGKRRDSKLLDVPGIGLQAAIIGSEKGNPIMKDVMDYYSSVHYADINGNVSFKETAPSIFAFCAEKYGFRYFDKRQELDGNMLILPSQVFPWNYKDICDSTIAMHCGFGSWVDKKSFQKRVAEFMKNHKLTNPIYEFLKYKI